MEKPSRSAPSGQENRAVEPLSEQSRIGMSASFGLQGRDADAVSERETSLPRPRRGALARSPRDAAQEIVNGRFGEHRANHLPVQTISKRRHHPARRTTAESGCYAFTPSRIQRHSLSGVP
jgi:hypothetical protein